MENRFVPTREPEPVPGAVVLGLDSTDELDVAQRINQGLQLIMINRLAQELGMPENRVLQVLGLPESTYHSRKRSGKPLNADESSRVYRIAKVLAAAREYFEEDEAAAQRWLEQPKAALGGSAPLEFSRSPEGSDYVVRLLQRMAHGVIS